MISVRFVASSLVLSALTGCIPYSAAHKDPLAAYLPLLHIAFDGQNVPAASKPYRGSYVAIAYAPSVARFVALGDRDRAAWTRNGDQWQLSMHNNGELCGICYGGGMFMAVGHNGKASTSLDGRLWKTANHDNGDMQACIFYNRRFIAIGQQGRASYSLDGSTWTVSNHGNGDLMAIATKSDLAVAVGLDGRAAHTTDGVTWTAANHNNGDFYGITYQGSQSRFVAVGDGGRASRSANGSAWTTDNHNNGDMRVIVGWHETRALGLTGRGAGFVTNWSAWDSNSGDLYDLVSNGSELIGVGQNEAGHASYALTIDGGFWRQGLLP